MKSVVSLTNPFFAGEKTFRMKLQNIKVRVAAAATAAVAAGVGAVGGGC